MMPSLNYTRQTVMSCLYGNAPKSCNMWVCYADTFHTAYGEFLNRIALWVIAVSATASFPLLADTPTTAVKPAASKPAKAANPSKMTCREFLEFDEVTRPQIVYWSEGFNKKGKPENAVIDVDNINRIVPVVVADCTNEPTASFWSKVEMEFKKVF